MPIALIAVGVLALGSVVAWTLLRLQIRRLERRLEESARAEAEAERRIRELLHVPPRAVNGDDPPQRRRHLWLVPAITGLLGALGWVASWVRHHPGPIGATAAGVAAITALLVAGSSTSDTRRAGPPEPPPIVAPRSPSSTTPLPDLPSPGLDSPSFRPPGGGTPTATVEPTEGMKPLLPPTTVTVPTTTVEPPATTPPPTTTTAPPTPAPRKCLARVELEPVLDACLLVHR